MIRLRDEVTCSNCWKRFPPEEVLWVSAHRDLIGDPRLGTDEQMRFLPSRFDLSGNALDMRGQRCNELACPNCHLTIPRALLEREPMFISILGTPTCGKSFFLGTMVHGLRRDLPSRFRLAFSDADPAGNRLLAAYEDSLFLRQEPQQPVAMADLIEKTKEGGDLYRRVQFGELSVLYSRPFSFLVEPMNSHPSFHNAAVSRKVISLYDNAGEHFLPGKDSADQPGTRHLAESSFILFLFDPTQDPRWLAAVREKDPQAVLPKTPHAGRQESVLREAAVRVQKLLGRPDGQKHDRPLLVVLNKLDVWSALCPNAAEPFIRGQTGIVGLNMARVAEQSEALRTILLRHIPELVYAAEGFCEQIYYMAASSLGAPPEMGEDGQARIRPVDIAPRGVVAPFVLGMQLSTRGLVFATKPTP
ncbi:MAG: hypothetical protein AB7O62_21965 [Pirellulales bacterium]